MKLKRQFYIGLDLGKKQDYSAIAVVEQCVWTTGEKDRLTFAPKLERNTILRHIERLRRGTLYTQVVERVREMLLSEALRREPVVLAFDATGVGEGVGEMVEKMVREVSGRREAWLNLAAVVFTSGQQTRWRQYEAYVPKSTILDEVVLRVEQQELWLDPGRPGVAELCRELQQMQRIRNEHGTRWVSVGEHDDLVMALGLAVWGTTYRAVPRSWEGLRWGRPSWETEAMRRAREGEGPGRRGR